MTTNTPKLALPYPDPTDTLQTVDDAIKALALLLDEAPGSSAAVALAGSVTGGGTVYRRLGCNMIAVDFTIPAGGLAVDGDLGTIPAGYRPPTTLHFHVGTTGAPSVMHLLRVANTGVIETVNGIAAGTRIIGTMPIPR